VPPAAIGLTLSEATETLLVLEGASDLIVDRLLP